MTFGAQSSQAAILALGILRLGVLNRGSGVLLDLHQAHPPVPWRVGDPERPGLHRERYGAYVIFKICNTPWIRWGTIIIH